ncbi:MAG: ATPase [Chloroflexi bacterium]|nr:ATPase [Chloroflexota bacterium]
MKKISSGVPGLDELLDGGIFERSSTVIAGPPGAGKTTFGLQFLYNGVTQFGESGIFVTFEEFPETIYRDALNLGWNLKREEDSGRLKVVFTSPSVLKSELEKEGGFFDHLVASIDGRRVVIDSATLMEQITEDPLELRAIFNALVNGFKRLGLTSILTAEVPFLFGDGTALENGLGFLVDNIFLLRFVEIESQLETALTLLKVRGSAHAKDIRRYNIGAAGISIKAKFSGRQGILTGFPSRAVTAETLLQEGLIKKRR